MTQAIRQTNKAFSSPSISVERLVHNGGTRSILDQLQRDCFSSTDVTAIEVPVRTENHQNILTKTLELALKLTSEPEDEGMILVAKQNYSIVGLLIGSVVKKAQNGTICRSYRIMPNETEIDYLISLRLDIKGTGSALVQDFLNRTAEFKTVVVRSEITKQAKNFYAKMGFKFLNKNPDLFIQEQQDKRPMERVLTHWTSVEEVAPMIFRR
jgi:hypothetical protein